MVTDRDEYLITKAIATTYALIGKLPLKCREESDRRELGVMLRHRLGRDWKHTADSVRHVLTEAEWEARLKRGQDLPPLDPD